MNYLKASMLLALTFVLYACPQEHDDQTGNFFIDNQTDKTLHVDASGDNVSLVDIKILAGENSQFLTITQTNGLTPAPTAIFESLVIRTDTDTLYTLINNDDWTLANITNVSRDLILTIE